VDLPARLPTRLPQGVAGGAGGADRPPWCLDSSGWAGYSSLMSLVTIRAELLGLPARERAKLIDVLWDSLASPEAASREAAWAAESERRIDAFEAGELTARPAGGVFSDLRKDLRE
jgi:putative addiction module component (TIGR02574 family)